MKKLKVALFVSRNKDNKDIEGYKQRKFPFLTSKSEEELIDAFEDFAQEGVLGETSRFYISVNTRSHEKTHKALLHYLIDNPDVKLESIAGKISSLASKEENRNSRLFLLDCDVGKEEFESIKKHLDQTPKVEIIEMYETPNGFGIITSGFDTRELLKRHPNVGLKRDGKKFVRLLRKMENQS